MEHILVFKNDLEKYPPLITIIEILLEHNLKVIYIGCCKNEELKDNLTNKGLVFYQVIEDDVNANRFVKVIRIWKYRKKVYDLLKRVHNNQSQIWLFGVQNIWILHRVIAKYNTILYLFELPDFKIPASYRFFCSNSRYKFCMKNDSPKVVCCEYNRAHITRSYFGLSKLPYIIPNKPTVEYENINYDVQLNYLKDKKIILYQGIFNYPERRLDELCQAMAFLTDDFVLVLMGGPENSYRTSLQEKYESARIIFLPFMLPPNHLSVTKHAYIGVLSYFSSIGSILHNLNTLYCAPNKLYEYSAFGIPMIANDIPALQNVFQQFNAGVCDNIFTPESLATIIQNIDANYDYYKRGSLSLFESVDTKTLIMNLIND